MASPAKVLKGFKVLLVEDSYLVAVEMRKLVMELGGAVIGPAKSVASATTMLASTGRPDMAILDVNLDGARVYPLAEQLRKDSVPFVFATGYEPWAIDGAFSATPTVTKPVTAATLVAAIVKLDLPPRSSTVT